MMPRFLLLIVACVTLGCQPASDAGLDDPMVLNAELHRRVASTVAVNQSGQAAHAWVSNVPGPSEEQPWVSYGQLGVQVEGQPLYTLPNADHWPVVDPESAPQVATGPGGAVYVAYTNAEDPENIWNATDIHLLRSLDGGTTWMPPVSIGGGFGSYRNNHELHVAADGTLYLAWLDADAVLDDEGYIHVVVSRSDDQGATWSAPVVVDAEPSCECCRVAVTSDADGRVYIAWRKILDGGIRDIVAASSTDGGTSWSAPALVFADNWVQEYCPDAGPALAIDAQGKLHVAWWTGKSGAAGVKYTSTADGRTFAAPVELQITEESRAAHVQLAVQGDDVAVVWDDGTLPMPRIALRRSLDGGQSFAPVAHLSPDGAMVAYPNVALGSAEWQVSWTQQGTADAPSRWHDTASDAAWLAQTDTQTPQLVTRRGALDN
ncbi:MAG: sialidase family protein [Bacteroidota bacterium]